VIGDTRRQILADRALSGAMMPDAGEIRLNGQKVTFHSPLDARGAGIETVYQTLALSPSLSLPTTCSWGVNCAAAARSVPVCRILDRKPCSASRARSCRARLVDGSEHPIRRR